MSKIKTFKTMMDNEMQLSLSEFKEFKTVTKIYKIT